MKKIFGTSEQICNSKESEVFCSYHVEHKMGLGGRKGVKKGERGLKVTAACRVFHVGDTQHLHDIAIFHDDVDPSQTNKKIFKFFSPLK